MRMHELSLAELRDLTEGTVTVAAAVEVGVFPALRDGPASAEAVARRLGLDPRAATSLLTALGELGFLEEDEEGFRLAPRSERELADPSSPEYAGRGIPHWLVNLAAWTRLPEALRTGRPVQDVKEAEEEPDAERDRISRFMAAMAAAPEDRIRRLVDLVLARKPEAGSVLDLGGGPGHVARAFLARGAGTATLLDTPETVEVVREEYAVDEVEGMEAVGADFLEDPLPPGPFDVVLLSNVLHMLPPAENARLLKKVRAVTAPGGVVAVADFIRGRSPRAGRFGLVMLLRTEGGGTYTFEEHQEWFRQAGFGDAEIRDLDPERQLVTAVLPRGGADAGAGVEG